MNIAKKIFFSIFVWLLPIMAKAQVSLGGLDSTAENAGFDLNKKSPSVFAGSALSIILSSVGVLFLILMIYGGYLWMTSSGNQEQVGKARNLIVASVIGLIIIVSAFAISSYFGNQFSNGLVK